MRAALYSVLTFVISLSVIFMPEPPSVQAGNAPSVTRTVPANQGLPGVATGILFEVGNTVTIHATGRGGYGYEGAGCIGFPQTDPDGNRYLPETTCPPKVDPNPYVAGAPVGALIGRIGNSPWFFVGKEYSKRPGYSGELFLMYLDSIWWDNSGSYQVTIETQSLPVDGMIRQVSASGRYVPSDPRAPAGVYQIAFTLKNVSTQAFGGLSAHITELTGGHTVVNRDGAPASTPTGVGSWITINRAIFGIEGFLFPGDTFGLEIDVGLQRREAFRIAFTGIGVYGDPPAPTRISTHRATADGGRQVMAGGGGFTPGEARPPRRR